MIIDSIWDEFLKIVAQEAGTRVVETWLKAVSLDRWDAREKIIYLKAPNQFVREWITSNYLSLFQLHLSRLLNVDELKIVLVETEKQEDHFIPAVSSGNGAYEEKNALVQRITAKKRCHVNTNYVFDTFVVGPSNQLAYAAAHAITTNIGQLYNPLFIYGGSGLGKTHLLHAIGNEIRQNNTKAYVLYQTTDRFVNEFIYAIRFDKVHQFQAKYKKIDVLLIDDVQFISNKEQTQEAFFHIFNSLYEARKQIVFSSDSYPADITGLAERLRSRLEWGLVTDVQIPPIETKIAILKRKAELHNEPLPDDVAYYVASLVVSNIRELEGSLIRVMAFASLTGQSITLELAQKVLIRKKKIKHTKVDFNHIISCLQNHYSYTLTELRSQNRSKQLSFVRQVAMYLMKKMTNKSLQEISCFLGRKDHSTVLYALHKIEKQLETDELFCERLKRIKHEISN